MHFVATILDSRQEKTRPAAEGNTRAIPGQYPGNTRLHTSPVFNQLREGLR